MPLPGRKRASLVLLLVLAAGLATAGAAAAAAEAAMGCCPATAAESTGCVWLGSAECCPERPAAPTPVNAAPPAPAASALPTPHCVVFAPLSRVSDAPALPSQARLVVLRL